jgi:hypothetical protein
MPPLVAPTVGVADVQCRAELAPVDVEVGSCVRTPFVGHGQRVALRPIGRLGRAVGAPVGAVARPPRGCHRKLASNAIALAPGHSAIVASQIAGRTLRKFSGGCHPPPNAPRRAMIRRRGNKGRTGRVRTSSTLPARVLPGTRNQPDCTSGRSFSGNTHGNTHGRRGAAGNPDPVSPNRPSAAAAARGPSSGELQEAVGVAESHGLN